MPGVFRVVVAFLLWALCGTAWATTVDVTFCVDVDVDFTQAGGDFWYDNSNDKPGLGLHYKLTDLDNSSAVVSEDFLSDGDDGPASGCTDEFSLTVGGHYRLVLFGDGFVDGNYVEHLGALSTILALSYSPLVTDTEKLYVLDGTAQSEYQQLITALFALNRHAGGLLGETYTMDDDIADPNDCCFNGGGQIHFSDGFDGKYSISHEVGHAVANRTDGGASHPGAKLDLNSNGTVEASEMNFCDGGDLFAKKFQSRSITEGIADWYAAITWNDRDDADCEYRTFHDYDVDLSGTVDYQDDTPLECWSDPDTTNPDFTDGDDWLDDLVNGADVMGCTTPVTNRATSWDWLTYLYHMWSSQGEGLLQVEVYDIWEDTTTTSWDPDEGTGTTADDPFTLWDGAATNLFPTEHGNQDQRINH